MDEVARWLRDGGLGGAAFESRQLLRLAQLQHLRGEGIRDDQLRCQFDGLITPVWRR